ncbi:MAG: hypothetical protein C4K49_01050 [Candidatus Thorarchaeota archaeon]|nr:MAG: hypothetical protein C4K49_01050 [Candidatus Thorarchaeota archaeon]
MLDLIAVGILAVSLIVLAYAEYRRDRRSTGRKPSSAERAPPTPPAAAVEKRREEAEILKAEVPRDEERFRSRKAAPEMDRSSAIDREAFREELASPSPPSSSAAPRPAPPSGMDMKDVLERKSSISYWERMCLKEEYDLIVTLHEADVIIIGPAGSTTKVSETTYQLPKSGQLRIVPVCSGCNISPSFRDVKVQEAESQTRAEFRVLPLTTGKYDLTVEFQIVDQGGSIRPLGVERVNVTIQPKPIQLNIGGLHLGVGRKVPTYFSMCGSVFGFSSFVFSRLGVNLEQQLLTWSATVSTGVAGAMMLLLAILLLARGLKPVMSVVGIVLKPR